MSKFSAAFKEKLKRAQLYYFHNDNKADSTYQNDCWILTQDGEIKSQSCFKPT